MNNKVLENSQSTFKNFPSDTSQINGDKARCIESINSTSNKAQTTEVTNSKSIDIYSRDCRSEETSSAINEVSLDAETADPALLDALLKWPSLPSSIEGVFKDQAILMAKVNKELTELKATSKALDEALTKLASTLSHSGLAEFKNDLQTLMEEIISKLERINSIREDTESGRKFQWNNKAALFTIGVSALVPGSVLIKMAISMVVASVLENKNRETIISKAVEMLPKWELVEKKSEYKGSFKIQKSLETYGRLTIELDKAPLFTCPINFNKHTQEGHIDIKDFYQLNLFLCQSLLSFSLEPEFCLYIIHQLRAYAVEEQSHCISFSQEACTSTLNTIEKLANKLKGIIEAQHTTLDELQKQENHSEEGIEDFVYIEI